MAEVNLHSVHDASGRPPEKGIALCLSGGGYRAMMFHAGCLWRLNEAGLLGRLDRISSVSGGSIAAGVLGMNWTALQITAGQPSAKLEELVIRRLRHMASQTVDEPAIFGGIFLPGTISDHVADQYDHALFEGKTLQDLPDTPRFVINATNVQSGVLMRFSKPYLRDHRVGQILNPKLPLARAVAASSAFPPVLSPAEIQPADYGLQWEPPGPREDLHQPEFLDKLVLTDGGVYDNLGLETAWKRYTTILVSDGGGHYKPQPAPHHDWPRHAYRILDLMDSQVRALRARQLMKLFQGDREGAYWGIRQDIRTYNAPLLSCPMNRTTELALTATRLQEMPPELQQRLINWGYAICDASLRRYFDPALPKPLGFPYPSIGV